MRRALRSTLAAIGVLVCAGRAVSAQQMDSAPEFARVLTPEQFRAAGLHKLTEAELDALNRTVKLYVAALAQLAAAGQVAPSTSLDPSPATIESRIDGAFSGWDGETIFKLANGQIWQQAVYAYRYHYAYGPKVLIYRSGGAYKMKVDGVDGEIVVRRLR